MNYEKHITNNLTLVLDILDHPECIKDNFNRINSKLFITQLEDDTTLFLNHKSKILIAIETTAEFSSASGLYLNINKFKLLAMKDCKDWWLKRFRCLQLN